MTEYYRFEDSPVDGGGVGIHMLTFPVIKETPRGVWIGYGCRRRFVLHEARKRYAYPTVAEAWESLVARRKRESSILKARAAYVSSALDVMAEGMPRDVPVYRQGHFQFDEVLK